MARAAKAVAEVAAARMEERREVDAASDHDPLLLKARRFTIQGTFVPDSRRDYVPEGKIANSSTKRRMPPR